MVGVFLLVVATSSADDVVRFESRMTALPSCSSWPMARVYAGPVSAANQAEFHGHLEPDGLGSCGATGVHGPEPRVLYVEIRSSFTGSTVTCRGDAWTASVVFGRAVKGITNCYNPAPFGDATTPAPTDGPFTLPSDQG